MPDEVAAPAARTADNGKAAHRQKVERPVGHLVVVHADRDPVRLLIQRLLRRRQLAHAQDGRHFGDGRGTHARIVCVRSGNALADILHAVDLLVALHAQRRLELHNVLFQRAETSARNVLRLNLAAVEQVHVLAGIVARVRDARAVVRQRLVVERVGLRRRYDQAQTDALSLA